MPASPEQALNPQEIQRPPQEMPAENPEALRNEIAELTSKKNSHLQEYANRMKEYEDAINKTMTSIREMNMKQQQGETNYDENTLKLREEMYMKDAAEADVFKRLAGYEQSDADEAEKQLQALQKRLDALESQNRPN